MLAKFENYDQRIKKINNTLQQYGIATLEEAKNICLENAIDINKIVKSIQQIAFDDAIWAYTVGAAIAIKNNLHNASQIAKVLGIGLQAFCLPGSVAEQRHIGIGHGNLASMLLTEKTQCFCFLAGHESFAAAGGALGIAKAANKVRTIPLKVILNGLGKDAAYIISRINGFTYVETQYDQLTGKLNILKKNDFSENTINSTVKVYGADDVNEGVAIMINENVDISITGNSTNPTRFQHPVAGTYKKWTYENNKNYFSVASGGGTGRTLHPDNIGSGPASYGMTDIMGRMHSDVQFAGSSSVPAHVEMMGFIGMGNNPIVGATVAISVAIEENTR
ncbi:MAG: GGGtGRT protein [Endomicrobium sp.]|nr:GGGtGRT protein [Endomicrobium sp.]